VRVEERTGYRKELFGGHSDGRITEREVKIAVF
jgi:hypothetical protein